MYRSRKTQILQKALLNSILPFVEASPQYTKKLNHLGKMTSVSFSQSKNIKERKGKCPECSRSYENYLLLFLHLELTHINKICVTKYQFFQENVTINIIERLNTHENNLFLVGEGNNQRMVNSLNQRVKAVLQNMFSKFSNRLQKVKRTYYHSTDIFREVGESSQDEDSDCDIGQIERELQRMRISDFSDVNDDEKNIFMLWNNIIYQIKKEGEVIDHIKIKEVLKQFAQIANKHKIKRLSMVMHAWTLWSIGKITPEDVTQFLVDYDSAQQ